ncbi:MAG: endolytic transglycosylase MltG [Candidatus Acidiferrales bacterium]
MKVLAIIVLLALLAAGAAAGYLWYCIEKPFGTFPPEGIFVQIPHGTSRRAAARLLEDNGVTRSAIVFEIYERRHPKRTPVAGEYFFDHPLSGKEVFWKLANGEIYQQPFTVREGQTIYDIARALQAAKIMLADDFLKAAGDPALISDLAPQAATLEGFLFPATYELSRHPAASDLTHMMVRKFRDAIKQVEPQEPPTAVPARFHSMLSIVTLASLVERETPKPEERPVVAGVYDNRLNKGMLLQCDPTVIYALQQTDSYTGPLTLKDLRLNSPYNTYLHAGLPPGPIGNPGEASLRAALNPEPSNYLYFVANTQGGHFFAATLAEHNKNVAKYHRLLKGEPADPPETHVSHKHAAGPTHKGKR